MVSKNNESTICRVCVVEKQLSVELTYYNHIYNESMEVGVYSSGQNEGSAHCCAKCEPIVLLWIWNDKIFCCTNTLKNGCERPNGLFSKKV